jgi:hypothetical protein
MMAVVGLIRQGFKSRRSNLARKDGTMLLDYSIYGLSVCSNHVIPGLIASTTARQPDMRIWLELKPSWLNSTSEGQTWYISPDLAENGEPLLIIRSLKEGEYFHLGYADGTEFIVDRTGTEMWATWPDSLTVDDTATYLLGPVMGFVLLLRGTVCLHASAIAVGNHAIALVGSSGAGKSTTAAAFARSGYGVLSEDVVALVQQEQIFLVQPAYPRIRLWAESVATLYGAEDALPCLTPTWNKHYLELTGNGCRFQQEPLPLAAIYILDERLDDVRAPSVEAVPASEGFIALVANTYATRLMDKTMRAREFKLLGHVMNSVPLRRVTPHRNPAYLSKLCEVILDDFQTLTTSAPAMAESDQSSNV